ncbi:EAL domain-containing protein [Pseudomonas fluorescens]|uniref:EAL domain-containing protein n=1 Tax=Pseudomonas fluorescens TaxID=294 RepID=A0A1T2Y1S2_PSEFL|nr:EAL domain-containing protein [Pseudomonas fluorescens]OPA86070.1 EAL domain-containing protein [Pseudomonas fluorescens]
MSPPAVALPASEFEVRKALAEGQIQPFFQPKFNLASDAVEGVEVLTRWAHPQRGVLSPAAFMPAIEQSGLLNELFFHHLHRGLTLQKKLRGRGYSLSFAYNLEVEQLGDSDFIRRVVSALDRHGVPASGITFELTERGALHSGSIQQKSLMDLKALGCRFSIDDFGTGFSNLQRLLQGPFSEIKLDASFVRDVVHDARCKAIVAAVIQLGQALGISVVLEGIETEAQRQALIELGGITGQGYLHARPMSAGDLLVWSGATRYSRAGGL